MSQHLKVPRGFDQEWESVLLNDGVPTPYPPTAPFDAAVWRGGEEAPLFEPEVTWIDSAKATFTVAVSAIQTVGLDPGLYRMQIGVSYGGVRSLAYDGTLEIQEAPGTTVPRREPYVEATDLLYWYDQLDNLQTIKGGDATFEDQRVDSSEEFDRNLITRYNENRHKVRTRMPFKDPVLDTFDIIDPAAVAPGPLEFTAIVLGGGVVIDTNSSELVAKSAISKVLARQEVMGSVNPYLQQAATFRAEVIALWNTFDIQVDRDQDGIVDMLVGEYIILIPPGTAP